MVLPLLRLVLGDDPDRVKRGDVDRIKTTSDRIIEILLVILIFANIAISIYSMYFVIRYIIEFQKLRDQVLAGIGCFTVIVLNIFQSKIHN